MNNLIVPTLTMKFDSPQMTSVTVQVDRHNILLTYWNAKGEVAAYHDIAKTADPDFAHICEQTAYDVVWNMDTVLALLDMADENEPACDVIPAWKWKGPWQPATTPDFRNPSQQADVA